MDTLEPSVEEKFVSMLFRDYYEQNFEKGFIPSRFIEREFGFGIWGKKIAFRHFAFQNPNEMKQYLLRNTPFYISYSTAYYEFPDARPMEKKSWVGAELVFDLDHVPGIHCTHAEGWLCDQCLNAIKKETLRLIEEFLIPDFGIAKNELMINFSGGKGYHVHINNTVFEQLSAHQRKDLVSYITGNGFDMETIGFGVVEKRWQGPSLQASGWGGKLANAVKKLFEAGVSKEELKQKSLSSYAYKVFANKENQIKIAKGIENNNWDIVAVPAPEKNWLSIINLAKEKAAVNIDASMTCDSKKLARLPDTLHGGTGFRATVVKDMESFDPLKDTQVSWEGSANVAVAKTDAIRIGDEIYGPYENQTLELPMNVAVFMLCKGVGKCPNSTK